MKMISSVPCLDEFREAFAQAQTDFSPEAIDALYCHFIRYNLPFEHEIGSLELEPEMFAHYWQEVTFATEEEAKQFWKNPRNIAWVKENTFIVFVG